MLPAGEFTMGVALEPPDDSDRIVWGFFRLGSGGIFVLTTGARERTRGCSPRAYVRLASQFGR